MKSKIFAMVVLVALIAAGSFAQSGSLYESAVNRMAPQVISSSGELAVPKRVLSMIATPKADPKTYAKNELITIIINESTTHSTTGSLSTERDMSIDASVDKWVRLHLGQSGMIQPADMSSGSPAIAMEAKRDFDGSGSSSRSDKLYARITGKIIDIKPNGNLVVEASKKITTEEETYTITVTGTCRTVDVTPDNTVLSSEMADLDIVKSSQGAVSDATKRSWLQRIFDFINIF